MKQTERNIARRQLLLGGVSLAGGLALWPSRARAGTRALEAFQAPESGGRPRNLILVQMFGGNDPLNTIVPYTDDAYYKARPTLALKKSELLELDDYRGFNPVLPNFHSMWNEGLLGIVEGIGYPRPNLSHFKSLDIWHAARTSGNISAGGWVGRLRDAAWPEDPRGELVAHIGEYVPNSIQTSQHKPLSFQTPESYLWIGGKKEREIYEAAPKKSDPAEGQGCEAMLARIRKSYRQAQATSPRVLEALAAYEPNAEYPRNAFGNSLRAMVALMQANFATRIFSVDIRNFDTHANQRGPQDALLRQVDGGIGALVRDLKKTDAWENTLIVCFSEFGRRVKENYSEGTDHGAAGSLFFIGPKVKGGLYGKHPSLTDLDENGNMIHTTDFRSAYATVIENWFGVEQEKVLAETWPTLSVLG